MSVMYIENEEKRAQYEREERMYHRIMRNGTRDANGSLVAPSADMTEEETAYYRRLLKERNGKIQYTI